VVNWNRRDLLRACLRSLTAQRTSHPFDVVVVDNGSDDGSPEMVQREFGDGPLRVRLLRNSANVGFCAGNNQGFAASNGEFVALLNNDAEADAGWLDALASVFESRPDVGMVASKILVHEDPRRIDKVGHLIYLDGQNRGRGTGEIDQGQYGRVEEVLWPDGCAAMYRRALLEQLGGFDEDFFAYADDAELGLRARIAGWNCLYVPEAVVRHHRASTLGLFSVRRIALVERNRILLAVKLFPWSLLWLNGVYYLARLAAGAWWGMRGQGEAGRFRGISGKVTVAMGLILGDLQALKLLPRMFRKRRQLKSIRKLSPSQLRHLILDHRVSLKELSRQSA